jgi:hypothetical protein
MESDKHVFAEIGRPFITRLYSEDPVLMESRLLDGTARRLSIKLMVCGLQIAG